VTASALVRGLASAQRLIGPVSLLLAIVVVLELGQARGDLAPLAPLAAILAVMVVTSLVLAAKPTIALGIVQLALGTTLGVAYAAVAISTLASGESRSAYLIEAVATALIFIGAIGPRAAHGIWWVVTAWMLGRIVERVPVAGNAMIAVQIIEGALGEPDDALLYHERAYRTPGSPA
jgi:hypothetical protein